MIKLDLGNPHGKDGFTGIDIQEGSDIVRDIRRGLPFADNTVDEVKSHFFLEHLTGEDVVFAMNEVHRVCKNGATVTHTVPTVYGDGAFQDPTHKSFWNRISFVYYCFGSGQKQSKHTGVKNFYEMVDQIFDKDNYMTVKLKVIK